MSTFFSNLRADAKCFFSSRTANLKERAMNQFCQWRFQVKDQKLVDGVLAEWFTAGTLGNILTQWKNVNLKEIQKEQVPLNILCYNVQGWGSRSLEAMTIAYKVEASICVFTEVGELWNTA
jgi:hypothetical protein